ncbi:MAG: type II secretion system F family protein [Candidatus Omnitrophica bacterium]|nr:type II secretion system F family protein [Candidatus Omnitrophota bacterium]
MGELLLYGLVASAVGSAAAVVYPAIARSWSHSTRWVEGYQQGKVEQTAKRLDDLFIEVKPVWLKIAYGVGPLAVGVVTFLFSKNLVLVLIGVMGGMLLPDVCVRPIRAMRRRAFEAQLVDALFILSSSLRAGLSLTQAFEQVESEMSPPISQEFGLMMKAYRLGLTFEGALQRLNERMPSEELQLFTTAMLVARETGGDVTHIISQLIDTIRERKKLREKVTTLTLQGRLQAYIMSALPLLFAAFVRTFNPSYFELLLANQYGQMALILAVGLWLIGMVLLVRLSRVEV